MSDLVKGTFSSSEEDFIRNNHSTMTDKAIGEALNRDPKSVTNKRTKLGLNTKRNKPKLTAKYRDAYIATMDEPERKKFHEKEVISSARYRAIQGSLTQDECSYYVEKYIDFMLDPTIETMTAMEKDALHQLLLSEIRISRHMKEEKTYNDMIENWDIGEHGKPPAPISRAKEIRECQEVILKCQTSLNVERKQRLKNQTDQSITFTNLIKEMKNPQTRHRLGLEATMLKVVAEQFYNSHIGKNIFSGHGKKFDISKNFRDGNKPDLPDEFLPSVKEKKDAVQKVSQNNNQSKT